MSKTDISKAKNRVLIGSMAAVKRAVQAASVAAVTRTTSDELREAGYK